MAYREQEVKAPMPVTCEASTHPEQCKEGQSLTSWLGALVKEHRLRLLAISRRRGLSPEEAFDCVQEAFLTFLRLPEAKTLIGKPEDSARLLTTITQNAARTAQRRAKRTQERSSELSESLSAIQKNAEELLEERSEQASLHRCVLALGDTQRAIVTLRMLEDHSGQEVAAVLGLSPQNVAVLLHRAKESLRGCMAASGYTH